MQRHLVSRTARAGMLQFRRSFATAAIPKQSSSSGGTSGGIGGGNRLAKVGAIGAGMLLGQIYLGKADNFFEHKFHTNKTPEDLADFYGTEDFMEIFCVLPFMVDIMMRGAHFDDEGTIHAWGLLGPQELEISIQFDEEELDITGNGEPDTLSWFNKKEHFHDVAPSFLGGFTLWEMKQNFGFHRLDDGSCEVYHHGESFNGLFPLRLLLQLHARYVIWATEKYINSEAFGGDDRDDELHIQRQNIPIHVFKDFLEGLATAVEKAKDASPDDAQRQADLEITIRRLKTISEMDHKANLPRLRTLRSHRTSKVAHTHLMVNDHETKETIHTAIKQIGGQKGQRQEPGVEMQELVRRTTLSNQKKQSTEEKS